MVRPDQSHSLRGPLQSGSLTRKKQTKTRKKKTMAQKKDKKDTKVKVRDLKPKKDAKGGGGTKPTGPHLGPPPT